MRITHRMITDTVLTNLTANQRRMEQLQSQLSSGKRLTRPADDPPAVERALTYRAAVAAGEQYLETMESSLAWLTATDDALGTATEILQRANELAVQGANGALGQSQMQGIAAEVNQLVEHLVTVGNATLRGQRLFAGLETDANPFTLNAGLPTTLCYAGDGGQMRREIDENTTVTINVPGNAFLPGLVTALINLRDHLQADDSAAVAATDVSAVASNMDSLLAMRADVGARANRIEAARDRQVALRDHLRDLERKAEDADLEGTVTELTLADTTYKASLAAAARAVQPSLLDYLR